MACTHSTHTERTRHTRGRRTPQGGTQAACVERMSGMLGEASSLEDGKGAVVPGARPPTSVQACARSPPSV